jgi:tripartite-type tricarboxylate transporter receptor subunit TctC
VIDRRRCLQLAAASALAPAIGMTAARGQPIIFPDRPVRLVVPFAPLTSADLVSRLLAARLADMWGQHVVVENHKGASGNIAADLVAHSDPDGYTLLLASPGLAINRFLFRTLSYDPVADFAPVSLLCSYPDIMVVPVSSPARTVQEFIDHAKANPGRITFASSAIGTSGHLAGEMFMRMAKIEMTHIPYLGPGPAYNDVIPGRVDVMFATAISALLLMRNGKLRGLAVTSHKRQTWAPDLPTLAEAGLPDFEVSTWYGLVAPAKSPPEILGKISADAARAVHEPEFVAQLDKIVTTAVGSTPEQLGRHLKSEMDKWGPVIAGMHVRPND